LRRKTTYSYTPVHGRSLLTHVDGPLPNGPTGTPSDSDITRLHYDEGGDRIVGVTHPMGMEAQFQYDTRGRLVSQTPVDGIPITTVMDSLGRVAEWKRGALHAKVQRDVIGRVRSVERNDGGRFTVHRDGSGRVVAVSDAQGNRREAKFDSEGRMLEAVARDASGQAPFDAQRVEYDAMGRPVAGSGGWQARYDGQGRLLIVEDALNRQSRYHYDSLGRFVEHELRIPAETAPSFLRTSHLPAALNSVRTRLLHPDAADGASGIVAANGARTTSDVDDFGRTVRLSSPDTGVETARYDEADRLLERIDAAGNRTTVQYDLLGRILSRRTINPARPDEIDDARWTYRGTLLVESANRHQSDTYGWDDQHRLIEQITRLARMDGGSPSHEFVTRYSYDKAGRLSEKRLPDGLIVLHRYDAHGAPAGLALRYPNGKEQPIIESLKADPVHGLREVTFGNGVVTAYAKDRQGRVAGIVTAANVNGDSKPLYSQRLTYDAGGRITAIERNGAAEHYQYDGQDRLVEVRTPQEQRRFAYDEVGNRTAVWQAAEDVVGKASDTLQNAYQQQSLTYQAGSNRLLALLGEPRSTSAAASALEYDATGNPIAVGKRRSAYGVEGRLREVTEAGRVLGRYAYNALDERVGKHTEGGTTYYLYADNHMVAEIDGGGRITAHYLYRANTPIAKIETRSLHRDQEGWTRAEPNRTQRLMRWMHRSLFGVDEIPAIVGSARVLYLHTDHIGALRAATDTRSRVVWKATYQAFGAANPIEDPDADGAPVRIALRLPGQQFDSESGLHYNYYRNYDPRLGRYLESDPIGLEGGINTYTYASSDPIARYDPFGLLEHFMLELNDKPMTKLKCGCGDEYPAFTGNPPLRNDPSGTARANIGPAPEGWYYLVDRPAGGLGGRLTSFLTDKDEWFALYRMDGTPGDDTLEGGVVRREIRLHPKGPSGVSLGCVTLDSREDYGRLRRRLLATTTSVIPGTTIKYYGTLLIYRPSEGW
jgi:RHS repeat-associated protein